MSSPGCLLAALAPGARREDSVRLFQSEGVFLDGCLFVSRGIGLVGSRLGIVGSRPASRRRHPKPRLPGIVGRGFRLEIRRSAHPGRRSGVPRAVCRLHLSGFDRRNLQVPAEIRSGFPSGTRTAQPPTSGPTLRPTSRSLPGKSAGAAGSVPRTSIGAVLRHSLLARPLQRLDGRGHPPRGTEAERHQERRHLHAVRHQRVARRIVHVLRHRGLGRRELRQRASGHAARRAGQLARPPLAPDRHGSHAGTGKMELPDLLLRHVGSQTIGRAAGRGAR